MWRLTTGSVLGYSLCAGLAVHCRFPPTSMDTVLLPHLPQNTWLCNKECHNTSAFCCLQGPSIVPHVLRLDKHSGGHDDMN